MKAGNTFEFEMCLPVRVRDRNARKSEPFFTGETTKAVCDATGRFFFVAMKDEPSYHPGMSLVALIEWPALRNSKNRIILEIYGRCIMFADGVLQMSADDHSFAMNEAAAIEK